MEIYKLFRFKVVIKNILLGPWPHHGLIHALLLDLCEINSQISFHLS